jgi:hypothetical protein|tara:strand:+ start:376 stop:1002 length:627 start_codon:yes stop_codon:yes gene_type:complete
MANSNVSFGLKPINAMGGTNPGSTNMYFIASNASAIFQGSPVQAELSGGTIQVLGNATGDTKQILGVFAGCEYVDNTTKKLTFSNTWPGSGSADTNHDIKGFVYDNPMQRFIICSDGTNTDRATAKADVFKTAEIENATSGSTTTGISTAQIDISTAEDSDPSNPLLILGIQEDVENADHSAAGIQYIVKLNNHVFFSSVGDPDAAIS